MYNGEGKKYQPHSRSGEVRHLYRAFKQECPNGIVDEETFKEVYDKIFPLGDSSHYAHLVFLSIDRFVLCVLYVLHATVQFYMIAPCLTSYMHAR